MRTNGQCSKGDSCSFSHEVAELRDEKDNRPLPHQIRRPKLTAKEKNPQKNQATEMKALRTEGAKFGADTQIVIIRRVVIGILPYVKIQV